LYMQKTCVILAGPTAVGKTALAIEVAKHYHTEIISADSRQCYKELNIGVAKPNAEELNTVPHHFIHCLSIQDDFTAADYEAYALQTIGNIFQKNNFAVVCGGTGLYIRAFVEGLDDIPAIAPNIRQAIEEEYGEKGINWLKDTLQQSDPIYALQGEMFNPNRMMRALEVFRGTGTSIVKFQTGQKKKRDFKIIQICLEMPRARLY